MSNLAGRETTKKSRADSQATLAIWHLSARHPRGRTIGGFFPVLYLHVILAHFNTSRTQLALVPYLRPGSNPDRCIGDM
ncbi:hypothetical protein OG21DRAFT_1510093, partial [Imleria badia]